MTSDSISSIKIKKASLVELLEAEDELVVEEPLEIQLEFGNKMNRVHRVISVTMRTPGNDEELSCGFLFTEGIIQNQKQVAAFNGFPGSNKALVAMVENEEPALQKADRNFYTTSSCG